MNNKFTTVISYERPVASARCAGSVIASSDIGALMRALGFMGLWLVLTVMLLAEPLLLNSKAAQEKREPIYFSHGVVQPTLPSPTPTPTPSTPPPHQLELSHAPTNAEGKLSTKLNATPLPDNQPARLSYALLTLK